jgi:DNA-binding LacI/PurR family transcriptional regulator
MERKKAFSAVQKAFDFVISNLERGAWQPGDCLPSAKHLARAAGVSFTTMIRAIALLKSQSLITSIERGHIRAGSGNLPLPQTHSAVWSKKRVALEKDILAGCYASQGRLPSLKEMQNRYGVCYQTMRKILDALVDDGVLQLRGKVHKFPEISSPAFTRQIVFITHIIETLPHSALNQTRFQMICLLERECAGKGIKLEIVEFDFFNSPETLRAISKLSPDKRVAGYVLDLWWYDSEAFRSMHIDLMVKLSVMNKPIAILDETGDFSLPRQFMPNPLFQVFSISGKKAGATVGRMLLASGHRSIAYISSQHSSLFSRVRLAGIVEQYSKAGYADGVRPIVGNAMEPTLAHAVDIAGFDEKMIRKISSVELTESQRADQYDSLMQFKRSNAARQMIPDDAEYFRKNLAGLIDLAKRGVDKEYFNSMCRAALTETGTRLLAITLLPLFNRALAYKEITAWVMPTDNAAVAALHFLDDRNIPVPGKLSIAGFDNDPMNAIEHHLTTYDFNSIGFTHAILNFIARSRIPRGPYHHAPMEVEGMVIRRDSTGKAKR